MLILLIISMFKNLFPTCHLSLSNSCHHRINVFHKVILHVLKSSITISYHNHFISIPTQVSNDRSKLLFFCYILTCSKADKHAWHSYLLVFDSNSDKPQIARVIEVCVTTHTITSITLQRADSDITDTGY